MVVFPRTMEAYEKGGCHDIVVGDIEAHIDDIMSCDGSHSNVEAVDISRGGMDCVETSFVDEEGHPLLLEDAFARIDNQLAAKSVLEATWKELHDTASKEAQELDEKEEKEKAEE